MLSAPMLRLPVAALLAAALALPVAAGPVLVTGTGDVSEPNRGPLLSDVLAAAGADGQTVTVQAMDGYAVEVPLADMVAKGAVLALERDGKPLGIGNFGPTQIVFPRADRPELADMPDDWWIWQIYHIDVQ